MSLKRSILAAVLAAATFTVVGTFASHAQQRLRVHTATEAVGLTLLDPTVQLSGAATQITVQADTRTITTNAIPNHPVGDFSNRPNQISAQDDRYTLDLTPTITAPSELRLAQLFGVAVNGIAFDPLAAEFWQGDRNSGWQYEALAGAVPLGLDTNFAHVQPTGAYHYHGLPIGLMQDLGWSSTTASPLIGWASDGFPIYALTAEIDGQVTQLSSSYQLKSGTRPGGDAPTGAYDGSFVQDYEYVQGAGDLDQCNGTWLTTADYPDGTYAYVLTAEYPVVPRCLSGEPDASFGPFGPGR